MEYIVASIGRAGSTLMCELISQATRKDYRYVEDMANKTGYIKKTHAHFKREPNFEYRAIFMNGSVGDTIASMYLERCNLKTHLKHLEVKKKHQLIFWMLKTFNKNLAFIYLIRQDKFRFKENIESWKRSNYTMFVNYEDLCNYQEKLLPQISNFLHLHLENFEVKSRKSSENNLPLNLQTMIAIEYGTLI